MSATTMGMSQAKGNHFKMRNGRHQSRFGRHIKENGYTRESVVYTVLKEYEDADEMRRDLAVLLKKHSNDPLLMKKVKKLDKQKI